MKTIEDIEKPCIKKVQLWYHRHNLIPNDLYDCERCPGTPGSCPKYVDHKALVEKYRGGL